jgi:lipoate-protein ligase A
MICRILHHETADGPTNMAVDLALLDAVDADPWAAVLRTYGWTEPTLSLGYFQTYVTIESQARWRGVPLVRRPSGGGALWHDREITYALVIPRSQPSASRASDLYRAVHEAIARLLAEHGVAARRRGPVDPPGPDGPERPFLCFADRDPEDVVLGPAKLVGSAQRRRPRAVLQHGALMLERSDATPELPGLRELAGPDLAAEPWADRLARQLPEALGLDPGPPGSLTPEERAAAHRLRDAVFLDPAWTRRR